MKENDIDFKNLLGVLHRFLEEEIPFNRVIGLKVDSMDLDGVRLKVDMKDELIGNSVKQILHGGVISAVLDVAGGITAAMGVLKKLNGRPLEEIAKRLLNVSTIDLRVDFLRPGRGEHFVASGSIMRTGKKVGVIRTHFHNDKEVLIAVGTGTYVVG